MSEETKQKKEEKSIPTIKAEQIIGVLSNKGLVHPTEKLSWQRKCAKAERDGKLLLVISIDKESFLKENQ